MWTCFVQLWNFSPKLELADQLKNTNPPPKLQFLKKTEGRDTHHQMRFEKLIWTKQVSANSVTGKIHFCRKTSKNGVWDHFPTWDSQFPADVPQVPCLCTKSSLREFSTRSSPIYRKRAWPSRTDPLFPAPGVRMTVVYHNSLKLCVDRFQLIPLCCSSDVHWF